MFAECRSKRKTRKSKAAVLLTFVVIVLLYQILSEWQQERTTHYGRSIPSGPLRWEVGVDPRVELVSIVFQLAGNPEYNRGTCQQYQADIRRHFRGYRSHPVVGHARALRETRWIGHDVPIGLAVQLADPNTSGPNAPTDALPIVRDHRWGEDGGSDFVRMVYDFAEQSDFNEFIADHRPLYKKTSARLRGLLARHAHFRWFDQFFGGRSDVRFRIVPGMVTGTNNYGVHADTEAGETFYCILGVWHCGFWGWGSPRVDRSMVPIVIHELCHSYCNPLVDAHMGALEGPARRIASRLEAAGGRVPYGNWQPMLYESVVRSCVIRYLKAATGERAAQRQLSSDLTMGFAWLPEMCELLEQYEANRDRYPTFEAFFPRIVDFLECYERP